MTVGELTARFPEVPADLSEEPTLVEFADTFDGLLRAARRPSACAAAHDAANHYYLKLVGPLSIYRYGLSTRERTLGELRALLDAHAADPGGFAASLVPVDAAPREQRGPGCD